MSPYLDWDPEAAVYLFACLAALVGSVVEWRRGGSDVQQLRIDVEVLRQTTASIDDWAALDTRCAVLEKLVNKLLDEWESPDRDDEDEN